MFVSCACVHLCAMLPDLHHVVTPLTSIMWFLTHLLDFSRAIGDWNRRQDIKIDQLAVFWSHGC